MEIGMTSEKKRIIVGKLGLDSHDNGLRIIAKWLMDSGYEVVYAGLYNTPQRIVQMAMEEGADAIGLSFLGGEHLYYAGALKEEMQIKDMAGVRMIIGGVIPPDDIPLLQEAGADAVFTPGTPKEKILKNIESLFL